jgi:hypothetical protein
VPRAPFRWWRDFESVYIHDGMNRRWQLHCVLVGVVVGAAGVWWALLAANDRGGWHIGSAFGLFIFVGAVIYGLVSTGLVAAWGRTTGAVLGLHLGALLLASISIGASCFRCG